jgi:aldose sugar dehydrogenase
MRILLLTLLLTLSAPTWAQEDDVFIDEASGARYRVEVFTPANFPVGLAFAPDGRLFYNEKTTGNVRVVAPNGQRQRDPVLTLPTDALQERGMLGIAIDPNFTDNRHIWVVHTAVGTARDWPTNKLIRFREEEGRAVDVEEMLALPITTGALLHNGGNVHFSPDGHLFIGFGDYGDPTNAQNLETMQGSMHRFEVTEDGLIPAAGNPFGDDNSAYAYGFRNPWDFDFEPETGAVWLTENGPSCDDEINLLIAGLNYGWSESYECYGMDFIPGILDYMPPARSFSPTIGITGIIFYDGVTIPEWDGDLFYCDWVWGEMHRAELNDARTAIEAVYPVDLGEASCKIDITVGPDGGLYFGTVGDGEGYIYRIVPA